MQFNPLNPAQQFCVGAQVWNTGILSAEVNGKPHHFAVVEREGSNQERYALKAIEFDGATVTNVELHARPRQEGLTVDALPAVIREHLAVALEEAVKQEGKKVDPYLVEAVRNGRDIKADRAEFERLTKGADTDRELTSVLRDELRAEWEEKMNTALEAGDFDTVKEMREKITSIDEAHEMHSKPKDHPARQVFEGRQELDGLAGNHVARWRQEQEKAGEKMQHRPQKPADNHVQGLEQRAQPDKGNSPAL